MLWLWLFISGLILVIVLLLIKIHLLRKSAKEIECSFAEKLITDSNTLIDISSNDKYMCHLANEINIQLRKLRAERRKFQKGDIELKNAVTNVSHDLRTPLTAIYGYLDLLEQEEKSEKVNRYIAVIKNRTEMLKQLTEARNSDDPNKQAEFQRLFGNKIPSPEEFICVVSKNLKF